MRKCFLFVLIFSVSISINAIEIQKLTCEFQQNPLAVNTLQPRFGWQLKSTGNGTMQSAYEIELRILNSPTQDYTWETGVVLTSQSQGIKYSGSPDYGNSPHLKWGEKYTWRVRVSDENGSFTKWSDWATFRTAPKSPLGDLGVWIGAIRADSARIPAGKRFLSWEMGTPEYKAVWKKIDTVSRKSIVLHKSFSAHKEIEEAITYICGLGHYEFSINGKKVGDGEFAPFWSDYDKTVYYNTFDITSYLKKAKMYLVFYSAMVFSIRKVGDTANLKFRLVHLHCFLKP